MQKSPFDDVRLQPLLAATKDAAVSWRGFARDILGADLHAKAIIVGNLHVLRGRMVTFVVIAFVLFRLWRLSWEKDWPIAMRLQIPFAMDCRP